jgi:hypothetical protein
LVCLVVTVVATQTGYGQPGECPTLRTDPFGFPLNPPYSEYDAGGSGQVQFEAIQVFKTNLPCCRVCDNASPPACTLVPANGTLELCIFPATRITSSGPFGSGPPPVCPALVTLNLTTENNRGAVRNCVPTGLGGGSNFSDGTGGNAV